MTVVSAKSTFVDVYKQEISLSFEIAKENYKLTQTNLYILGPEKMQSSVQCLEST
jgi:hypothetical protein